MTEVEDETLAALERFPTAYFTDAFTQLGLRGLVSGLRSADPNRTGVVAGRALTARFMPARGRSKSDVKLYDVIYAGRPGDILVIEAPYPEVFVGDLVTSCAEAAGFAGIIIDGLIRDARAVQDSPVPVWSRGHGILRPGDFELQSYGEPVSCGGAQVHSRDVVIADADGAAVVPPEDVGVVLEALRRIGEIETELDRAIGNRRSLSEIYDLFKRKAQIGIPPAAVDGSR